VTGWLERTVERILQALNGVDSSPSAGRTEAQRAVPSRPTDQSPVGVDVRG
jgi:hypothetical protein